MAKTKTGSSPSSSLDDPLTIDDMSWGDRIRNWMAFQQYRSDPEAYPDLFQMNPQPADAGKITLPSGPRMGPHVGATRTDKAGRNPWPDYWGQLGPYEQIYMDPTTGGLRTPQGFEDYLREGPDTDFPGWVGSYGEWYRENYLPNEAALRSGTMAYGELESWDPSYGRGTTSTGGRVMESREHRGAGKGKPAPPAPDSVEAAMEGWEEATSGITERLDRNDARMDEFFANWEEDRARNNQLTAIIAAMQSRPPQEPSYMMGSYYPGGDPWSM
jgi:hypothetical protein